jgi:tRNA1Val (adenine37-N6)-methyltransferase
MITEDTFFNGKLKVYQYKNGYRYSIDSVLLADNIKPFTGDKIVELGIGCGIISLIIAFKNKDIKIFGIEIQKELYDIAALNVKKNGMEDIIKIFNEDFKTVNQDIFSSEADIVFSNPPYRKIGSGRLNENGQKAKARHEINADINDVVFAAKRLLKRGGKFSIVYPAERLPDIIYTMRHFKIEPKLLQTVHSTANDEAKLILITGIKNGRPGMKISAPYVFNIV